MIDKSYGKFTLSCDICGERIEGELDSFNEIVDHKKAAGWCCRKIDGEWQDVCPECADTYLK